MFTPMPPVGNGTTLNPCGRLKGMAHGRMKFNRQRQVEDVRAFESSVGRCMFQL